MLNSSFYRHLCTLVDIVNTSVTEDSSNEYRALEIAFQVSNHTRRGRRQWLVNSSRSDFYHQEEWADSKRWSKAETCFEEIKDGPHRSDVSTSLR
jgi:salicylate hydroxylase